MDVINYLLAKRYVDSKISQVETAGGKLDYQVVDSLPETGSEDLIYLVPVGDGKYGEYRWQDGKFIKLKDTLIADLVSTGYLFGGVFWSDASHSTRLPDRIDNIYIDNHTNQLYYYSTTNQEYLPFLSIATSIKPGVMKLYNSTGQNEDGTMTQKIITDKLNEKVELDTSYLTDECLGLKVNKN